MNKIIESLLSDFRSELQLDQGLTTEDAFEHFAANLTLGVLVDGTINTFDSVVGEDAQPGVDAIGIVINGSLIKEIDEVEAFVDLNTYLDVDFVFIQAKTSSGFATSALGDLADLVSRLFGDGVSKTDNKKVGAFCELKDEIYKRARYFKRRKPIVHLYYVTTGQKPVNDQNFIDKESLVRLRLMETGLLESVKIDLIGSNELQKRSLQMANSLLREIDFPKRVALPEVPGVTQSFLGVLPATAFLRLVQADNGNLLSSIFYDNVRDWQGLNEVNKGMHETLVAATSRPRFALMNNGVTVIAKKVRPTGDKLILEDYQIVNGCQTSNVIWACRNELIDASAMIPLKIVATEDEAVIRDIIRATNSQTEVSQSQLLAVTDFQKQLEIFFGAQGDNSLYYERRSRQFVSRSMERARIVTPIGLVKAFSSMFLEEPHKTARDFASVLKKVGSEIFEKQHKHEPYFLAALCFFWIEVLLKKGKIDSKLGIARYQILLCVRLLHETEPMPAMSSNKVVQYSNKLQHLFRDIEAAERAVKPAVEIVQKLLEGKNRDTARTATFTASVKTAVLNKRRKRAGPRKMLVKSAAATKESLTPVKTSIGRVRGAKKVVASDLKKSVLAKIPRAPEK